MLTVNPPTGIIFWGEARPFRFLMAFVFRTFDWSSLRLGGLDSVVVPARPTQRQGRPSGDLAGSSRMVPRFRERSLNSGPKGFLGCASSLHLINLYSWPRKRAEPPIVRELLLILPSAALVPTSAAVTVLVQTPPVSASNISLPCCVVVQPVCGSRSS